MPNNLKPITVVNKHHGVKGEYIGRGSPLGNPYPITKESPRDVVIDKYVGYINQRIKDNDPVIIKELSRLYNIAKVQPLNLMCFCSPQKCHGDVIKHILVNYDFKPYR